MFCAIVGVSREVRSQQGCPNYVSFTFLRHIQGETILAVPEFYGRGICESLRAGEEAMVCAEYPSHISPSDAQRYLQGAKLSVSSNNRKHFSP